MKAVLPVGTIKVRGRFIESATVVAKSHDLNDPMAKLGFFIKLVYRDYDEYWMSGGLWPKKRKGTFAIRRGQFCYRGVPMEFTNAQDFIDRITHLTETANTVGIHSTRE